MPIWNPLEFEFTFPPKLQTRVHHQRGKYHEKGLKWIEAKEEFENTLKVNSNVLDAVLHRSRVESELGNTKIAHDLSRKVLECREKEDEVPRETDERYMNTLYDMNELEESLAHACNSMGKEVGVKESRKYEEHKNVVRHNLNHVIGRKGGPCLKDKRGVIAKIQQEDARKVIDSRPFWIQLRDQGECDTVSIVEEKEKRVSQQKKFAQEQNELHLNQVYLGYKTANDIRFLKKLSKDSKKLQLVQTKETSEILEKVTKEAYKQVS